MYPKTLILLLALSSCWASSDVSPERDELTELHRLGRSMMTVAGATLDAYAPPTLPCHGEGYYSHTSDYTKFYRCIDVFGNKDYLRLAFTCQKRTIFSYDQKSCIAKTYSQTLPSLSASTSAAADGRDDVIVVPSFKSQGMHSSVTSNEYGSSQCSSEGRFVDTEDCGQYYDCILSHSGRFVAHRQSCFGNAFHPTLKACVPPKMVEGCAPHSTRSFTVADSSLEKLCNNAENEFLCADCKTLVICVDGSPYTEPCKYGSMCSLKRGFKGGVCYPGEPSECTCNKADIFRRDFYNPSKFLSCDIEGTDPIIHSCPEGLVFNEQRRTCGVDNESSCTASGTFAVKTDCSRYYTCIFTTGGWIQKEFTCRNNTMFNEDTGNCEDPCDWYTGHFACEAEGRYANPSDCSKYYECFADPINPHRFTWEEHECPEGYEWNQMVKRGIGHCVASGTAREKCVPLKANKCKIPSEWCKAESMSCNSQITHGRSYFVNPNSQEHYASSNPCMVDVLPHEDTYQIRLDFEEFSISPPNEGECSNDTFIVTGANSGTEIPIICGENSGQHMYIDVDSTDDPIKMIISTSALYFPRSWKIRVSFMEMNDPNRAPNHCLQYHKGTTGQLMSFNYGPGTNPTMINNLKYGICFAYVPDFCDIALNFDRFDLGPVYGECINDYLGVNYEKHCGDTTDFSILANTTAGPISLFVSTDDINETEEEGFIGSYTMLGC